MSVSGVTLEEARHRINAWMIDDWPWRIILSSSSNILLSSRGILRWRTDDLDLLEFSWAGGMAMDCGSNCRKLFWRKSGIEENHYGLKLLK
jgi:hypothetical protein